jgi:hypothetical protein
MPFDFFILSFKLAFFNPSGGFSGSQEGKLEHSCTSDERSRKTVSAGSIQKHVFGESYGAGSSVQKPFEMKSKVGCYGVVTLNELSSVRKCGR